MRRYGTRLLALFAATILAAGIPSARADIRTLRDTPDATVLEATFAQWRTMEFEDGSLFAPLRCDVDAREGGRATPFLRTMVALPGPGLPRVVIEEQRWDRAVNALPPAGHDNPDLMPVAHLDGRGPVVLGEPYRWRGRWVADLFIVPVRREGERVTPLQSIRLRLEYGPSATGAPREDRLANALLANPRAASRWAPARSLAKPSPRTSAAAGFPDGTLYRIETTRDGMHQITVAELRARGLELTGVDPTSLRMFGNGGRLLPSDPGALRDTNLQEIAIHVDGGADGSFDDGDRILFYARSVNGWVRDGSGGFEHLRNPYTNRNVYWLSVPDGPAQGRRMQPLEAAGTPGAEVDRGTSRIYVEEENLLYHPGVDGRGDQSGTNWYATFLSAGQRYLTTFEVQHPVADRSAQLRFRVYVRRIGTQVIVKVNSVAVDTLNPSSFVHNTVTLPAGRLFHGSNTFTLEVTGGALYMDALEVAWTRDLRGVDGRLAFDALPEYGDVEVTLAGIAAPWVFEVSDHQNVRLARGTAFTSSSIPGSPDRYLALEDDRFLTPEAIVRSGIGGPGYAGGLRSVTTGAEYVIVAHENFMDAAAGLEAFIEERDQLEVLRVDVQDVFDEFAWGLYDPTAIRDFLMHGFHTWTVPPRAVLLVGDGDYDYRNLISSADANWIPPWQDGAHSYDHYYVTFSGSTPDLIIGRLPVQQSREVEAYTEKLVAYETVDDLGDWKTRMVLVADDEWEEVGVKTWNTTHMEEAEALSTQIAPDYLEIKKIYVGTYPTAYDPATGARRKPLANQDLIENINRGALLVNFIGHGNAHVWTHENVLVDSRDGDRIDSGHRMPIYFAATCAWGHWDRPANESHPEKLLSQRGGGIGVIAATRKTYSSSNRQFSGAFYEAFFDRQNNYTLGEALLRAKVAVPSAVDYHCLGDPMLRPALPRLNAVAGAVNPDPLTALAPARVSGSLRDLQGDVMPGFSGEALVTVYDGADSLAYTFLDSDLDPFRTLHYTTPGGILFRGLVSVEAGGYEARFIVPRDVKYGSSDGRVHMYVFNRETDGVGSRDSLTISLSSATLDDNTPPEMEIFFDHRGWRSGDMVDTRPSLIVDLHDTSGINLTGDVGHHIRAIIDGDREVQLTEDFLYETDSYTRGSAQRPLYDLEPGSHRLEVWAWDNANNLARAEASFTVVNPNEELRLRNVLNWPNPFADETSFTFELSAPAEVTIKVFTASGRLIREIGPVQGLAGFNHPGTTGPELRWNGADAWGDPVGNGVYLYRLEARGASGQTDETIGKLLRIR